MGTDVNATLVALSRLCADRGIPAPVAAELAALVTGPDFETEPPGGDTFGTRPPTAHPESLLSDRGGESGGVAVQAPEGDILVTTGAGQRYEDIGLLGVGGMGEVRRVRDNLLQRRMAMKLLHPRLRVSARGVARFVEEAQVSAQLAHPGIVPIYDLGRAADGRWFFTMQEVRGRTLTATIRALHRGGEALRFRRIVDAFLRVCETVAYAHARGVIHRDLKPGNVMIGSFGRVLVLDWGLARVLEDASLVDDGEEERIETARRGQTALATMAGAVTGTPAYMAPEQAHGRLDEIGPQADVYALGAILYEILAGRPPHLGASAQAVLAVVRGGTPPPPPSGRLPVPAPLSELAMACMARAPEDRPAGAAAVAAAVAGWLDGAARRERAQADATAAAALRPAAEAHTATAERLRSEAHAALQALPQHAPVEDKLPAWALLEAAEGEARQALRAESEWLQRLHAALSHDPDLPEARDRLADHYQRRHLRAEAAQDTAAAADAEAMLRVHDRGRWAAYLRGDGTLTLHTDPPGAQATLLRYEPVHRRLEPQHVRSLGATPLVGISLPMGSYRIRLEHPACQPLELPVCITRQQRWDNVRPGSDAPSPVRLLPPGALGPLDRYAPAGWLWVGDRAVDNAPPRSLVWVDSFVIQQHPVTVERFLAFLNDLAARGEDTDQLAQELEKASYTRGADGAWSLGPDEDGEVWDAQWPAIGVSWHHAARFAAWQAARDGLPWRLPSQWEWEKAARGVDGRIFPWGDHFDANWGRFKHSLPGRIALARVSDTPLDVGPYGVYGMAGNVSDWCADAPPTRREQSAAAPRLAPPADPAGARLRWHRGGTCGFPQEYCRLALRFSLQPDWSRHTLSFRLARSL